MEDAAFQDAAPAFNIPSKKSPKRFIYLVIAIIIVILIFVFFSRFFSSSKKETQKPIPTTTVVEKITPTPEISKEPDSDETPTPTVRPTTNPVDKATGLDRSKLNIEVQNGSGVVGAAGKVSDFLKDLGYRVGTVGNADNFDYTGVTISVNSAISDYLELLKSDLSEKYTISLASSDLSASVSADALVIIGK